MTLLPRTARSCAPLGRERAQREAQEAAVPRAASESGNNLLMQTGPRRETAPAHPGDFLLFHPVQPSTRPSPLQGLDWATTSRGDSCRGAVLRVTAVERRWMVLRIPDTDLQWATAAPLAPPGSLPRWLDMKNKRGSRFALPVHLFFHTEAWPGQSHRKTSCFIPSGARHELGLPHALRSAVNTSVQHTLGTARSAPEERPKREGRIN